MKKVQGILAAALCAAVFATPAFAKCDGEKAQANAKSCCAGKQMTAKEKADHCATADKASCEVKGAKAEKATTKKAAKVTKAEKAEVKTVKETSNK